MPIGCAILSWFVYLLIVGALIDKTFKRWPWIRWTGGILSILGILAFVPFLALVVESP